MVSDACDDGFAAEVDDVGERLDEDVRLVDERVQLHDGRAFYYFRARKSNGGAAGAGRPFS